MSTVLAQREEVIKAPELRGAVLHLFDDPGLEQGIDGPAGCIAGETRIYNPVTGEHVPVKDLYEKEIAPIVQTLMGAIQAEVPFRKGVADLYRVTLSSSRQCVVTGNHRVLTPKGWEFVSTLSLGDLIGVVSPNAQTSWDAVASIEYVRTDEYFDLHVPVAEHYLAEGIWHHNTGKTFGIMYVLHCLLSMYPGTKWLAARKRHVDLVGSSLATFRESVLDERENVHFFSGNKERPAAYEYPNGSLMVVNGLDRPGKVKSMDFDGMYICEATDCDLEDIEMCHIRLARRKDSRLPRRFQKLLMDFNPSFPDHFLNLRMNSGLTHRLNSRHEDNPFLYDSVKHDWTEAGRRYIAELETLTGVRLARYRYGIWAAAEGTVYEDSWDRNRNVIDRFPIPKEWPRYMLVDFGYTNPFVCKWYAMDPDGRFICYREIYMTKRLVEDHCKTIATVSGWFHLLPRDHQKHADRPAEWADPLPREIICDHDAEDRATLERHLGLFTTPAVKNVSGGIQVTAARYRPAGDGIPRLRYFRDCLVERDRELAAKKKPTSSIEEPDGYVWKQGAGGVIVKEEPVKEDDHGMDTDRYLCSRFDLQSSGVSYFRDIWK
jgi:hypothetical protein